jgi:MFS transporter, DHA2 family, lincomycin resistance protein
MTGQGPGEPVAAVEQPVAAAGKAAEPGAGSVIWLLVGAAFVMILNETIMGVALPVLIRDLAVPAATAQWLTSGYMLTMAVVIPVTGFLLQRYPPRGVFLTAMALFSAGLVISASAPGFGVLLLGRVVQAAGTAVMVPLVMTTVLRLVPAEHRGATMGRITIVIAVAPAVGPTLSGVILGALSWRWTFWVVLPIALLALAAGAALLRLPHQPVRVPIDGVSVLLSAVAFSGLVFGLTDLGAAVRGQELLTPGVPVAAGAVATVLFAARQRRLQRRGGALLDLRPFAIRAFVVAMVLMALGMTAMFGALIVLPLYLQAVRGVSSLVTGLLVLPGGLVMGLLGPVVGRGYDRLGARPLVIPGALLICLALGLFTLLDATSPLWLLVTVHVLLTGGLALMFTPLMTDALGALPAELYAHGSAIVSTLQQVTGAAGTALFVTVLTLASGSPSGAVDAAGAHAAFVGGAAVSVLVVAVSFLVRAPSVPAPEGARS